MECFPPDFAIAVLDGNEAGTRAGFFQEIARDLRFPDYFGRNWDAVYDCLTDLNWLPAAGYVVVLDGFDHLAMNEPGQWDIGLKVLREACAFWRPLPRPMYALLSGPGNWLPACRRFPPHVSHRGAKLDESEKSGSRRSRRIVFVSIGYRVRLPSGRLLPTPDRSDLTSPSSGVR